MSSKPKCTKVREDFSSGIQVADEYAIYYFAKPAFFMGHPKQEILLASLEHIRSCAECQVWLKDQVSQEVFLRLERVSKYCCIQMFSAVEESRTNQITFEMFRGEDPCWKINGKRSFISFCPWCGERLPGQPFIVER